MPGKITPLYKKYIINTRADYPENDEIKSKVDYRLFFDSVIRTKFHGNKQSGNHSQNNKKTIPIDIDRPEGEHDWRGLEGVEEDWNHELGIMNYG